METVTKHYPKPWKIIWRYKNDRQKVQYGVYIFVGSLISKSLQTTLAATADLTLLECLTQLEAEHISRLTTYYGEQWYVNLFTSAHITQTFNEIEDTGKLKVHIRSKWGEKWYEENISRVLEPQLFQPSYALHVARAHRSDRVEKLHRKLFSEIDFENNYLITTGKTKKRKQQQEQQQKGGRPETDSDSIVTSSRHLSIPETDSDSIVTSFHEEEETEDISNTDDEIIPVANISDYQDLYDIDEDVIRQELKEINALSDATQIKRTIDKAEVDAVTFDETFMDVVDAIPLSEVYTKVFVNQFIYDDDTIETIKNKIYCGITLPSKFTLQSEPLHLHPKYQYLWGVGSDDQKIMIGQVWLYKGELLTVNTIPATNIHVYDDLPPPLDNLHLIMTKYNMRTRMIDNNNMIVEDYMKYIRGRELFLLDLFNDLGLGFNPSNKTITKLEQVYLKLYFPQVSSSDFLTVLDILNNRKIPDAVTKKLTTLHEAVKSSLAITNETMNTMEKYKIDLIGTRKLDQYFGDILITQTVTFVDLDVRNELNLFKIFNNFVTDDQFPFVQYQSIANVYKYSEASLKRIIEDPSKIPMVSKWFNKSLQGLIFKVKVVLDRQQRDPPEEMITKYMTIILKSSGKLEYKTQWKEADRVSLNEIVDTYTVVHDFIHKIAHHDVHETIPVPRTTDFQFALINSIQQFSVTAPEPLKIDHNDFSDFTRYFFPYLSLVISPRKRQAVGGDDQEVGSKYGTYLRYKRVSNYGDLQYIERRIIYLLANYEATTAEFLEEIQKQFNLTKQQTKEIFDHVKIKYPKIRRSRKVLKQLSEIKHAKTSGIGIDIQGKDPTKYKIRISGARNRLQIRHITNTIKIVIYLYYRTYVFHDKALVPIKDKLKNLLNVATRMHKVLDVVDRENAEKKEIKKITSQDKQRVGFRPEKGQNQWSRSCQNSGGNIRQPRHYTNRNFGEMVKNGYTLNEDLGLYERIYVPTPKAEPIKLYAIKLTNPETEEDIYYTCDPEHNGEYMHIGFLTKTRNPHGQCMPCCFKKPHIDSTNEEKRKFFWSCLADDRATTNTDLQGEVLYVLQDTNKIKPGRIGYMPKFLDIVFNQNNQLTKKIKQHYLEHTESYFFKYGVEQVGSPLFNCVCDIFDLSVEELKARIIAVLRDHDRSHDVFTYLNAGEIKSKFETIAKLIEFIKFETSNHTWELYADLLTLPGILASEGVNLVVFAKKEIVIARQLEKDQIREDFTILHHPGENHDLHYRDLPTAFIIRDDINYFPIVMVQKPNKLSRDIQVIKHFQLQTSTTLTEWFGIINEFYVNSYNDVHILNKTEGLIARDFVRLLADVVQFQVVDRFNKCRYVVSRKQQLIPVRPSGIVLGLATVNNTADYIQSLSDTIEYLQTLAASHSILHYLKPVGLYYTDDFLVNSVVTEANYVVPVANVTMTEAEIVALGLWSTTNPLSNIVNQEIARGKDNYRVDARIMEIKKQNYLEESFNIFRLELSEYLSRHKNIKTELERVIADTTTTSHRTKIQQVKLILYQRLAPKLYDAYMEMIALPVNDNKGSDQPQQSLDSNNTNSMITLIRELPDVLSYVIENDRTLCSVLKSQKKCGHSLHCGWTDGKCNLLMTKESFIKAINRVADELVENNVRAFELLQAKGYYVPTVVDMNRFTIQPGQKLIRGAGITFDAVINSLFNINGKTHFQHLGLHGLNIGRAPEEEKYLLINVEYPLRDAGDHFIQAIFPQSQLLRAYTNGYYWQYNIFSEVSVKNLGYLNPLQTDFVIYFRGQMIDWLLNVEDPQILADLYDLMPELTKSPNTIDTVLEHESSQQLLEQVVHGRDKTQMTKLLLKKFVTRYLTPLERHIQINTNCLIELYVLSIITKQNILVLNEKFEFIHGFQSEVGKVDEEIYLQWDKASTITIMFVLETNQSMPNTCNAVYYKGDVDLSRSS